MITKLIERGVNPNIFINDKTPLHLAILLNVNIKIVEHLINNKADVNLCTKGTLYSPLQIAVKFAKNKHVDLLLENSSDINYLNPENGYDAFSIAMEYAGDPSIAKKLIEKGCIPDRVYDGKRNALHLCLNFLAVCERNNDDALVCCQKLISINSKKNLNYLNQKDSDGVTALMSSAEAGYPNISKELIELKCDITSRCNDENKNALSYAVQSSSAQWSGHQSWPTVELLYKCDSPIMSELINHPFFQEICRKIKLESRFSYNAILQAWGNTEFSEFTVPLASFLFRKDLLESILQYTKMCIRKRRLEKANYPEKKRQK